MERIVLSPKYLHEIRNAPESVLSLREGMSQVGGRLTNELALHPSICS